MFEDSRKIVNQLFGKNVSVYTTEEKEYFKYLFDERKIVYVDDKSVNVKTNDLQILFFEQPDLLLVCDNKITAIEHFIVDASRTTKKGSLYKQKYNSTFENIRLETINKKLTEEPLVHHTERITTKLTYDNLLFNVKKCIDKHYSKIEQYDKKIKSKKVFSNCTIEYVFFIEYDIIFPSFIVSENNAMLQIFPHNDIALINYINDKIRLSGMFFYFDKGSGVDRYFLKYYKNSKPNFNKYLNDKNVLDLSRSEIIDFDQPILSTVSFTVPNSHLTTAST